jgi:DNA-binding HxlR family transcriptional regulator
MPPVKDPMAYDLGTNMPTPDGPTDPLAAALDRVGDRWSLLLIEALLDGPRRFSDLAGDVAGIAPNILADRLRRLEGEGIIRSTPYQERPVRLSYALTAEGTDLAGALRLLADWGSRTSAGAEPLRHAACGTPVEARLWCPTCARAVETSDADGLRHL